MIDEKLIQSLIDFDDEVGILSFYVGITPDLAANTQPPRPIEIRNRIKEVKASVKDELDHDGWKAVHDRLDALDGELDRFMDPKAHGRGRALFVAVSDGRTESVSLQVPFAERVIFGSTPYIRPLVAAYDEGRPAGIAIAHRGGVRVLEWRFGEVEELSTESFEFGDAQRADIKSGPTPDNPRMGGNGVVNRERFEDRLDANRRRMAKDAAKGFQAFAEDRGWDRVVVTGERHVRQAFAESLPNNGFTLLVDDHLWEVETPRQIADAVWPQLRSVHQDRERELVEQAKDLALSGRNGALGMREVLAALNEARVAHLLFDDGMTVEGLRVPDEDLLFIEEGGAAADAGYELVPEPRLLERMCVRALSTDASITPCDEGAAELLAEHDGVAALLRW